MSRTNFLRVFAAFLLMAGMAGCGYLDRKEGEWIFRPASGDYMGNRGAAIAANFQERWIPVGKDGEKLHAWWAPATGPDGSEAPVLLYLHGARWNLTGSVTRIPRWNQMGFSVLAIDYRGFGKSSPHDPSEQSAYEDSEAAWAYLAQVAPHAKRYVYGHSLGGAMATRLAVAHPEANGLILEATFTNIPELVKYYPLGFLPVGGLITQRFDNLDRIAKVSVPILFVHGTNDTTVPSFMSEKLYQAARSERKLLLVEGGNHHDLARGHFEEYRQAVQAFVGMNTAAPATSAASAANAVVR